MGCGFAARGRDGLLEGASSSQEPDGSVILRNFGRIDAFSSGSENPVQFA